MKTLIALGCLCTCALLVGCDGGSSVQKIDKADITTPPEQTQPSPGGKTKFQNAAGGVNMGSGGAGAAGGASPAGK